MFGMVQRQATMVAFVSIFQLLADRLSGDGAAGAADEAPEGQGRASRRRSSWRHGAMGQVPWVQGSMGP